MIGNKGQGGKRGSYLRCRKRGGREKHLVSTLGQVHYGAMKEIVFEVLEDPAGGFTASAVGLGIHTQGEDLDDLKAQLRDAVDCYFDESEERPSLVRLQFVREELMAV
jgi:predicted RNase H-like HicB family nuclease